MFLKYSIVVGDYMISDKEKFFWLKCIGIVYAISLIVFSFYTTTFFFGNHDFYGMNKDEALALVEKTGDLPVPLHIRNAPTKLMKELGYGENYKYAHNYEGNFVDQEFLPQEISGTRLYEPSNNAKEAEIRRRMAAMWEKYKY